MSKIVQRVRRDLHEIADQAPISPAARDSILSRVDTSVDHSEREVVMLDKKAFTSPRRTWGIPVAIGIAVVAALAIAGIVIIRSGGDDAGEVATVDSAPAAEEDAGTAEQPAGTAPGDQSAADEPANAATVVTEQPAAADEPANAATVVTEEPAVVDEPTSAATVVTEEPAVDEFEQLVALPWASPDDAHATPQEAVQAFLDFLAERSVLPDSARYTMLTLGDFTATAEQSGEITITGAEEAFHDVNQFEVPFSTVTLRQADGHWWVAGATSDTLVVDQPARRAVFGPPMTVSGENGLFSDALQLHVYVDGDAPTADGLLLHRRRRLRLG